MASETGKKIGAVNRTDTWAVPVERIKIRQEDPSHPGHRSHMARVSLQNPEFVGLVEAMRIVGWQTGSICFGFTEKGENGETITIAATAKRRVTAARIVNAEWKASGDKRYPIIVPLSLTKDPVMAENIENAFRAEDPPLVRARRYLACRDALGAQAAAASNGFFSVKDADAAVELLKASPELQGAFNNLEIPAGLAKGVTDLGHQKAREVLAEATDGAGRVDGKKLKKALKTAKKTAAATNAVNGKKPLKIMPAAKVVEIKKALVKAEVDPKFVAFCDFLLGKKKALDEYPTLRKAILGDEAQA